ncbi:TetR/AcrR family transcriptional regulator [Bacillus sp. Bva_UNVM-123]|uniref:TetR/AcrR family transcriptional regulator n=1 Tax=Bacillus sp. Bva_UNVM-123 TaxID=2829798 RepID=UPI00391F60DF
MYSAFEKQSQEKKELIMNIAIEEFTLNGYDTTSTDTITSRAGISKGILFHYFKSKKNLYLYLVNFCIDLLTEKTVTAIHALKSADFFERVKEIYLLKHEITGKFTKETQLIADAIMSPPVAVQKEMQQIIADYYDTYAKEFKFEHVYLKELIQIDKLRDDITVEQVIEMTMFISEQLGNKYQTLYKNNQYDFFKEPDPVVKELNDYLKIIKYGIYKEC